MPVATTITWSIALVVMILGPIVLASRFWRRFRVRPLAFAYGALAFVVLQGVRTLLLALFRTPLSNWASRGDAALIGYLVFLAFTAGLFESIGRWAGYRWLFPRRLPYDWAHAVAYGIGHGGIESVVLVGFASALSLVNALVLSAMPVEQLQSLYQGDMLNQALQARDTVMQLAWYEPLLAAVERIGTVPLHIALSLVVLRVFTGGGIRWLLVAILIHGLADFTTVYLSAVLEWPNWAVEASVLAWGAASLAYILWTYRRWRAGAPGEGVPAVPKGV
jgi:uncharacterized membrane protein YhfC